VVPIHLTADLLDVNRQAGSTLRAGLARIPVTMTARQWGLLSLLAVLWGGAFFFSKVALGELRPFTVVLLRFGVAGIAMLLVVRLTGHRMPRSPRTWAGFVVLGALNNFIPFSLITWGQVHITSGPPRSSPRWSPTPGVRSGSTPIGSGACCLAWGAWRC